MSGAATPSWCLYLIPYTLYLIHYTLDIYIYMYTYIYRYIDMDIDIYTYTYIYMYRYIYSSCASVRRPDDPWAPPRLVRSN